MRGWHRLPFLLRCSARSTGAAMSRAYAHQGPRVPKRLPDNKYVQGNKLTGAALVELEQLASVGMSIERMSKRLDFGCVQGLRRLVANDPDAQVAIERGKTIR